MDYKNALLKAWQFVFPKGNCRWYVWFIPAVPVIFTCIFSMMIIANILVDGLWFDTGSGFIAHMTMESNFHNDLITNLMQDLFWYSWYIEGIFSVWLGASILIDIGYILVDIFRRFVWRPFNGRL